MELLDLGAVVDVQRYPVMDLEGPRGRALIAQCRRALAAQAICLLPGFLRDDAVSALFTAPESHARRPAMAPGCFVLFNGRLSMHRVSPLGRTKRPRIMAIFSYDQRPDMVFSKSYIDHVRSFPQDAVSV